MIHHTPEGGLLRNGLNWSWDTSSEPRLVLKLGKYVVYFRRRSARIMAESDPGTRRYIFEWGLL